MLRSNSSRSTNSSTPGESEMHEIIRSASSEESISTTHRPDLTIIDDRRIQRPDCRFLYGLCNPVTHRPCLSVHRTLSHLKEKLIPHRHRRLNSQEKTLDYVMVEKDDSGYVSMSTGDIDQQRTRRGQSCVLRSTHDDSVDLDRIQFMPTHDTSLPSVRTASLDHPLLGPTIMPASDRTLDSNDYFDPLSTRSGVECDVSSTEIINLREPSAMLTVSTASPSSTNSSTHEYTGIDRSILDNTEYIRGQQVDLERLTLYEIGQLEELSDLQDDMTIYDTKHAELDQNYPEFLERNARLIVELAKIRDEHDLLHAPWTCTNCTYINDPCSETKENVCQMCESPSPLKQMLLMR